MTNSKVIALGIIVLSSLIGFDVKAQESTNIPKISGAMKNVMWKGQLYGTIHLDTIASKQHLYGLGPVEYLSGEILIFDGIAYKSTVVSATEMIVTTDYNLKAPFFVHANIEQWEEHILPDSIQSIQQLENYLDELTQSAQRPFMFKMNGVVKSATIHIVNLPKGSKVNSPEEAHKGKTNYFLKEENVDILGFFSTEHKSILTHHDTYVHLHLITADKKQMGHLDDVVFKQGTMKIYLPK
ncbi:acetolactate decarboxylase [Elizabethkingia anophelis]|uniref:acetolactate decarboxylase n=1 Tax=Elizabethkingia anophelis TaxID=1117645 RepID=UPI0012B2ED07|nr:acetolactate decarboxylase [Elizabethkingia anophelis]QGN24312.1 alpha-acetolactate decarboxylase [Elizabethkingia anophelis]QNV10953.1 alpha-acetolactate decarboxylase [Elizabethkingia anophelis]UTF89106.1 acetolactate decarboxylase [Elizabethkingia anophelis]UTG00028.1 acetolactate decarboxylase [Elizabethkingia anophelis]UTG03743.1 acetolactate decarboxylase [Elizabethkingia anophelis]